MVTPSPATRCAPKGSKRRRSATTGPAYASGLGANLRRIRRAQHLSVEALAELARLSPVDIASVEAGADPALETLWALALALDVSFLELVIEAGPSI